MRTFLDCIPCFMIQALRTGRLVGLPDETILKLLIDLGEKIKKIKLDDPPPKALFLGFGESSLDFELRVFIPSIDYLLQVKSDLNYKIDQAFRKAGVEIAFPQRDLHIRSVQADLPVSMRPQSELGEPSS